MVDALLEHLGGEDLLEWNGKWKLHSRAATLLIQTMNKTFINLRIKKENKKLSKRFLQTIIIKVFFLIFPHPDLGFVQKTPRISHEFQSYT